MSIQSRYHSESDAQALTTGALVFGTFSGRKGVLRVVEYLGTYPDGTVLLNAEEGGEGGPLMRAVVVKGYAPVDPDGACGAPPVVERRGLGMSYGEIDAEVAARGLNPGGCNPGVHRAACAQANRAQRLGSEPAPYRGGPKRGR